MKLSPKASGILLNAMERLKDRYARLEALEQAVLADPTLRSHPALQSLLNPQFNRNLSPGNND